MGRGPRRAPARRRPRPAFAALLVSAPAGLSTAAVYGAFDRLPAPAARRRASRRPGLPALAAWVRNDLWPAALALAPGLGATARALRGRGGRRGAPVRQRIVPRRAVPGPHGRGGGGADVAAGEGFRAVVTPA